MLRSNIPLNNVCNIIICMFHHLIALTDAVLRCGGQLGLSRKFLSAVDLLCGGCRGSCGRCSGWRLQHRAPAGLPGAPRADGEGHNAAHMLHGPWGGATPGQKINCYVNPLKRVKRFLQLYNQTRLELNIISGRD